MQAGEESVKEAVDEWTCRLHTPSPNLVEQLGCYRDCGEYARRNPYLSSALEKVITYAGLEKIPILGYGVVWLKSMCHQMGG